MLNTWFRLIVQMTLKNKLLIIWIILASAAVDAGELTFGYELNKSTFNTVSKSLSSKGIKFDIKNYEKFKSIDVSTADFLEYKAQFLGFGFDENNLLQSVHFFIRETKFPQDKESTFNNVGKRISKLIKDNGYLTDERIRYKITFDKNDEFKKKGNFEWILYESSENTENLKHTIVCSQSPNKGVFIITFGNGNSESRRIALYDSDFYFIKNEE